MRKHPHAFTMIELLVVMVIMGFMATMVLPRMFRRSPSTEWTNILDDVNNLILFARQEAIANQRTHRLRFKVPRTIVVEEENVDPENPDKKIYQRVYSSYFSTQFEFAESISIHGVYEGKKEMTSEQKGEAYCYVIADGLVQDVVVRLARKDDAGESQVQLKVMPFVGQFQLVEGNTKA